MEYTERQVQNGNPSYNIAGPRPTDGFSGFTTSNTAALFTNGVATSLITLPSWNLNTNTVTIAAWVNPSQLPVAREAVVFWRSDTTFTANGFGLYHSATTNANGHYTLAYNWNNDPGTYNWNSGLELPVEQWSLVSLAVTPTNATISVINANGYVSSINVYNHTNQTMTFGNNYIGYDLSVFANPRNFNGTIDDVSVFARSLSQNELSILYLAAAPGTLPPTASFTLGPVSGTAPLTVNFTNTSTGYNSALWTFGDGGSSVSTNVVVTYIYTNAPASYTVSLTVSNSFGLYSNHTATNAVAVTTAGPIVLSITHVGQNLQLNWTGGGSLLQATNLTGPWVTNLTATPPFLVSPTNAQMFFRVMQ